MYPEMSMILILKITSDLEDKDRDLDFKITIFQVIKIFYAILSNLIIQYYIIRKTTI